MSNSDLKDTLTAIARSDEKFYRDTGLLLKALDDLEAIKAKLHSQTKGTKDDE